MTLHRCFSIEGTLSRFIISGGISTGIDFLLYMFLSSFLWQDLAKVLSISVAMCVSYHLNRLWAFCFQGNVFGKFLLCQAVNVVANVSLNHLVFTLCNHKLVSFAFATIGASAVNFMLQKYYVFYKKEV